MKKINYFIYLVLFTLALTSCNDWLDVSPEDEIGEEELFADGEGYRNALNGVYKAMAEFGLYGRHLSWGIVDALAQYYEYEQAKNSNTNDMGEGAAKYIFDYEDFKKDIESVWSKAYNCVANCNNIIQNIAGDDPEKFVYKEWEKNMIWGEALALRAFIQFDMLRLFAPAPVANPTKAYLPYISVYPSYVPTKLTVKECLGHIIDDLKAARPLVAQRDTLVDTKLLNWFEKPGIGDERFIQTRGYRLNYWAVTALLARVYLYAGMPDEAYEEARRLIDVQEKKRSFAFNSASTGGRKLYSDVIAGLYAPKVYEWEAAVNDLTAQSSYDWKYLEVFDVEKLYEGDLYYDDYYGKTTSRDYRFKEQLSDVDGSGNYVSLKYRRAYGTSSREEVSNTLVPLIRMSEMYYIAAEVMAEKDLEQAKDYLFKVKSGRGFYSSDIRTMRERINSVSLLKAAILNDARRDFIGEGQMFFMYKRLGEPIPAPEGAMIPATEEKFVIPVPDSEISIK